MRLALRRGQIEIAKLLVNHGYPFPSKMIVMSTLDENPVLAAAAISSKFYHKEEGLLMLWGLLYTKNYELASELAA